MYLLYGPLAVAIASTDIGVPVNHMCEHMVHEAAVSRLAISTFSSIFNSSTVNSIKMYSDASFDSDETCLPSDGDLDLPAGPVSPPLLLVSQVPAERPQRKRKMPLHIRDSVVQPLKRAVKGISALYLYTLDYIFIIGKMKVKCNQSGKVFLTTCDKLTKENGEDLVQSDIYVGNNVLFTDDGKEYDVQLMDQNPYESGNPACTSSDVLYIIILSNM